MALRIPSTLLGDTDFITFEQDTDLIGGFFQILNASAEVQLLYGKRGQRSTLETVVLTAGSYSAQRSPSGIPLTGLRARNGVVGQQSTILGYFWDQSSPTITFVGVAAAGSLTSGSMQLIQDQTLVAAAAQLEFLNIPSTFAHLMLVYYLRGDDPATAQPLQLRCNNDGAANYSTQFLQAAGAAVSGTEQLAQTSARVGALPTAGAPASVFGSGVVDIPGYASATGFKNFIGRLSTRVTAAAGGMVVEHDSATWFGPPVAINRLTVFPAVGNLIAGSRMTLYGIAAA